MVYHSDEIPLDIGFSLTGQLPLIETNLSFPGTKPHFLFSRTMHILVLRPLL